MGVKLLQPTTQPPLASTRRRLLGAAAATALVASSGCGYLLYPERRGRAGGRIDVGVLIIDLLWLLPGLLPGAICLAVDFTTGCIYEGGALAARERVPADDTTARLSVDVEGVVVAQSDVRGERARLASTRRVDEAQLRRHGRISCRRADGAQAECYLRDLI